jgi:hypothetical protein
MRNSKYEKSKRGKMRGIGRGDGVGGTGGLVK